MLLDANDFISFVIGFCSEMWKLSTVQELVFCLTVRIWSAAAWAYKGWQYIVAPFWAMVKMYSESSKVVGVLGFLFFRLDRGILRLCDVLIGCPTVLTFLGPGE